MSQTFSIQEGRAVHQLYIVEAICDFWKKLKIFDDYFLEIYRNSYRGYVETQKKH